MRISKLLCIAGLAGLLGAASPAHAFDVKALQAQSPSRAFQLGFDAYRQGDMDTAVKALQFAADKGSPLAQWKLGRMYAAGDGIGEDDFKAFQLFRQVANGYADQSPSDPTAPFIASAFVELGHYYQGGIPRSGLKSDPQLARQMYSYAASYFGDADAQFYLAQMYYRGEGGERDPRQAARWSKSAAQKGSTQAEALLGHLMFEGDGIQRQPVVGLLYLTAALQRAVPGQEWIREMQEQAFARASEQERRSALAMLKERDTLSHSRDSSAASSR